MKKISAILAVIMAVSSLLFVLSGCSKPVTLKIDDQGTVTEFEAKTGKTVKEILESCEIALGEKDETDPAADTKIEETTTVITIKRYAKVNVIKDGETKEVELCGATVADAIKEAGFKLEEGYAANVADDVYLTDVDGDIVISRKASVKLTCDGETKDVFTDAGTVEEFLAEQKIKLGKDDIVEPAAEEKIGDGDEVTVKRVEIKEETKTETIKHSVQKKYSASLEKGKSKTESQGSDGTKSVTYKVTYVDGKETDRTVINEKVIKEAVSSVVVYGTKSTQPSSGGSSGKTVVKKQAVPDCDGSGHGYYIITYSDGSTEYQDY